MPARSFTLEALNDWLSPHGIVIVRAEPILEGKANANFRVETALGETLLFRHHQRDAGKGALEFVLAQRLEEEAFMPRVLVHDAGRGFSLVEWKSGRSLEACMERGESSEVGAASEGIGSALAHIERHTFPFAGELDARLEVPSPWSTPGKGLGGYAAYLLEQDRVRQRIPQTELSRLKPMAKGLAEQIDRATPHPVLVHGDFKASNLLIDDGELSAVTDWEFAHAGSSLLSIGQLFRHPLPIGFEDGFVRGYFEAGGRLPDVWRRLARRVDIVNLLDFLNRPNIGPNLQEGILKLLAATD